MAVMAALPAAGCADHHPSSAAPTSPPSATGTLTVQAGTGTERFPVPGVAVHITACSANTAATDLTTDQNGTVTEHVPAGCYRAAVTAVPSGCGPDAVAEATADVKPNDTASLYFLIHCA
jgi:hypothetical protein